MQIVIYNTESVSPVFDDLIENVLDVELRYKGTDLVSSGLMRFEEMQFAVKRAINICKTSQLVVRKHFKPFYVSREGVIIRDWKLSQLARKLVLVNGDSNNKVVAKIQLELLEEYRR